MKRPGPIIKLFTEVAPEILRAEFRADSCINATRVTIEVLKCFGVSAKPMSVRFVAMNAIYHARFSKMNPLSATRVQLPDEATMQQWVAEGGWALGIDIWNDAEPGKWAGHLVALAQDHLIDASARQFNRPEKKIVLPDIFVGPITPRFLKGKGPMIGTDDTNGAFCWYFARPEDESFKHTPGWSSLGNAHAANAIIYAMAQKLGVTDKLAEVP